MTLVRWIGGRVAGAAGVWLTISLLAFSLSTLAPGDPAHLLLMRRTGDAPSEAEVQALRHRLGLDQPFATRYGQWLSRSVRGDFGTSYRTGQPVLAELAARFPATLALALSALMIGLLVALPLALAAAAHPHGTVDRGVRLLSVLGISLPGYWLAYVLMFVFALLLGALPVSGGASLRHLVLPALTLGLGSAARLTRILRASLLEETGAEYARTARAKGLSAWRVLSSHALRNAANPLVTISALRFGHLLGEAVIVETVFAWPGIGRWMVESILDRDYPAIQGFVLYIATIFVIVNVGVDLAYRWLDPRMRLGGASAA